MGRNGSLPLWKGWGAGGIYLISWGEKRPGILTFLIEPKYPKQTPLGVIYRSTEES